VVSRWLRAVLGAHPAGRAPRDCYGRKRVMVGGLILFGLGSIACAYAPTPEAFIAARLVLGLAGAALTVMALSMITVLFSEEERPRAVGIWSAANFLAFPIGPILGGWMLANFWWGWVFLINVPSCWSACSWSLARARITRTRRPASTARDRDIQHGAGLVTYGLIEAGLNGWVMPGSRPYVAG